MKLLYTAGVKLYGTLINLASPFVKKAKQRTEGLKLQEAQISNMPDSEETRIWFHCASLGEFEQGRPLIEEIKKKRPETKIILTFFSASGYEQRKNYAQADYVFYLPTDSASNADFILNAFRPNMVFWVKYEFWHYYLSEIKKRNIPLYLISGIFRPDQIYFKSHGTFFKSILEKFTFCFVQDDDSLSLLKNAGIKNALKTGDTRMDRVIQIAESGVENPIAAQFAQNSFTCVIGSSWPADEAVIFEALNELDFNLQIIIAPHEITENHISDIEKKAGNRQCVRYSQADAETISSADILIIDNIGMLSGLYRFANVAYIGGGFGAGIHNTPEAAVYGVPVIFGPRHDKFREAHEMLDLGACFAITNGKNLTEILQKLTSDEDFRRQAGQSAKDYIYANQGAVTKIYDFVFD